MKVFIENTEIELTKEQIALIENTRKEIANSIKSFVKVLKYFGFTKMQDFGLKNSYEHIKYGWYAEVEKDNVWIVGKGLQSCGFPGGYIYWEPSGISEEILKFLERGQKIK